MSGFSVLRQLRCVSRVRGALPATVDDLNDGHYALRINHAHCNAAMRVYGQEERRLLDELYEATPMFVDHCPWLVIIDSTVPPMTWTLETIAARGDWLGWEE